MSDPDINPEQAYAAIEAYEIISRRYGYEAMFDEIFASHLAFTITAIAKRSAVDTSPQEIADVALEELKERGWWL